MPTLAPLSLPTVNALSLDHFPAPLLCPLPDGSGVLVEDWSAPGCSAYHVPASLMAAVRRALDLRPASLAAARAALPRVIAVHPGEVWPAVTLELDTGASIYLGEGDRAALHPVSSDGLAVLVCWSGQAVGAECAAPAALLPELAPYFPAAGQA